MKFLTPLTLTFLVAVPPAYGSLMNDFLNFIKGTPKDVTQPPTTVPVQQGQKDGDKKKPRREVTKQSVKDPPKRKDELKKTGSLPEKNEAIKKAMVFSGKPSTTEQKPPLPSFLGVVVTQPSTSQPVSTNEDLFGVPHHPPTVLTSNNQEPLPPQVPLKESLTKAADAGAGDKKETDAKKEEKAKEVGLISADDAEGHEDDKKMTEIAGAEVKKEEIEVDVDAVDDKNKKVKADVDVGGDKDKVETKVDLEGDIAEEVKPATGTEVKPTTLEQSGAGVEPDKVEQPEQPTEVDQTAGGEQPAQPAKVAKVETAEVDKDDKEEKKKEVADPEGDQVKPVTDVEKPATPDDAQPKQPAGGGQPEKVEPEVKRPEQPAEGVVGAEVDADKKANVGKVEDDLKEKPVDIAGGEVAQEPALPKETSPNTTTSTGAADDALKSTGELPKVIPAPPPLPTRTLRTKTLTLKTLKTLTLRNNQPLVPKIPVTTEPAKKTLERRHSAVSSSTAGSKKGDSLKRSSSSDKKVEGDVTFDFSKTKQQEQPRIVNFEPLVVPEIPTITLPEITFPEFLLTPETPPVYTIKPQQVITPTPAAKAEQGIPVPPKAITPASIQVFPASTLVRAVIVNDNQPQKFVKFKAISADPAQAGDNDKSKGFKITTDPVKDGSSPVGMPAGDGSKHAGQPAKEEPRAVKDAEGIDKGIKVSDPKPAIEGDNDTKVSTTSIEGDGDGKVSTTPKEGLGSDPEVEEDRKGKVDDGAKVKGGENDKPAAEEKQPGEVQQPADAEDPADIKVEVTKPTEPKKTEGTPAKTEETPTKPEEKTKGTPLKTGDSDVKTEEPLPKTGDSDVKTKETLPKPGETPSAKEEPPKDPAKEEPPKVEHPKEVKEETVKKETVKEQDVKGEHPKEPAKVERSPSEKPVAEGADKSTDDSKKPAKKGSKRAKKGSKPAGKPDPSRNPAQPKTHAMKTDGKVPKVESPSDDEPVNLHILFDTDNGTENKDASNKKDPVIKTEVPEKTGEKPAKPGDTQPKPEESKTNDTTPGGTTPKPGEVPDDKKDETDKSGAKKSETDKKDDADKDKKTDVDKGKKTDVDNDKKDDADKGKKDDVDKGKKDDADKDKKTDVDKGKKDNADEGKVKEETDKTGGNPPPPKKTNPPSTGTQEPNITEEQKKAIERINEISQDLKELSEKRKEAKNEEEEKEIIEKANVLKESFEAEKAKVSGLPAADAAVNSCQQSLDAFKMKASEETTNSNNNDNKSDKDGPISTGGMVALGGTGVALVGALSFFAYKKFGGSSNTPTDPMNAVEQGMPTAQ